MSRDTMTREEAERSIASDLDALDSRITDANHRHDWLKTVYNRRKDQFSQDNERIWRTGQIFIPSAFAGLAFMPGVFGTGVMAPLLVLPIAAASCGIMHLWVVIADHHRAFQNTHVIWLDQIDKRIGLSGALRDASGNPTEVRMPPKTRWSANDVGLIRTVQQARRLLATMAYLIWASLMLAAIVQFLVILL
jgi:hypothetical protein